MSLLSIVTRRHPKRDSLFKICKESLQKQTCQNFEHVLIIDDVGRGVEYANKSFYKNREKVTGKYVFISKCICYYTK